MRKTQTRVAKPKLISKTLEVSTEHLKEILHGYSMDEGQLRNAVNAEMLEDGLTGKDFLSKVRSWRIDWADVLSDITPAYNQYLDASKPGTVDGMSLITALDQLRLKHNEYNILQGKLEQDIEDLINAEDEKQKITCTACRDPFDDDKTLTNSCGHAYCHDCLNLRFQSSVAHIEEILPPQCCKQPFDVAAAMPHLHPILAAHVQRTMTERQTAANNRIYCASSDCGLFIQALAETPDPNTTTIPPAQCTTCKASTCKRCRKLAHPGDCEAHDVEKELSTLYGEARALGFKNCGRCGIACELLEGCNHVR